MSEDKTLDIVKQSSGLSSIFKVIMSLQERLIPPTINIRTINPSLKLDDIQHENCHRTHAVASVKVATRQHQLFWLRGSQCTCNTGTGRLVIGTRRAVSANRSLHL